MKSYCVFYSENSAAVLVFFTETDWFQRYQKISSKYRSIFCRCSSKQVSLKTLCTGWSLLKTCNLIKKRLQNRCFPVNIANFFKSTFFNRTPLLFYLFSIFFHSFKSQFLILKWIDIYRDLSSNFYDITSLLVTSSSILFQKT